MCKVVQVHVYTKSLDLQGSLCKLMHMLDITGGMSGSKAMHQPWQNSFMLCWTLLSLLHLTTVVRTDQVLCQLVYNRQY